MIKNKVLITGGAGLVGSHIADQLVKQGVSEIVILDNFVRGKKANLEWAIANGNINIIEGDIRDQKLLNKIMPGVDVLFHQAAIRITQCAEDPRLALEVLVDGTYNVLESAVKSQVKKVIAASSASVLGMAEEFPTTESHHPYNNRTFYGAAKTFNEGMLRTFNEMYGLDYVALRYFNVYGTRMDIYGVYTEVLVRWMDRIIEGKPPLIFGNGLQTMDFISVEDIARANILAAQSDIRDDVFNIASGIETSLNDLAFSLLKVMKSDLKPEYADERTVNPVQKRLADTSKAERLLGFKAEISLEEGLTRLVDWWKTTKNFL
ncbi:SDR family NAD(P)-dependent oxidoreductase [Anabaena cylindrica FACHB-243]|uniref:UDP-glucose 4-epimerase n=1 Tax=Anabaena cylindrica (strain ATCC 27899 / PCC 7122) TaxID=272123 RepID=K9ZF06_ANACC|nr:MULTISPECIES: SDR family NAD(P)-dependent oxidoreductase [Anabaena]AFZ56950.1 UDP-glucose 4-epimerase [Anabaena cylindrica PCC 7122]MBD2418860.1 SDR family NAD(P)-dependent oxidoreductase [Anabaena cylindrica FACHB-243]MBY5285770.1 SDR family NAD(P)-dependent oxidoreductase [Anabaena sp. CCAP 1446/1C]MBY5308751.1 SDR family NAD(P)-dependent oxidoreductase [Anabaena sp. CCAP 1446/1C]MCM2405140.1 SDR family NAD(P)-dependent oxidoreductase [Anabaena sp. CCAP 1446/1C]